jgi:hypothetical protein
MYEQIRSDEGKRIAYHAGKRILRGCNVPRASSLNIPTYTLPLLPYEISPIEKKQTALSIPGHLPRLPILSTSQSRSDRANRPGHAMHTQV